MSYFVKAVQFMLFLKKYSKYCSQLLLLSVLYTLNFKSVLRGHSINEGEHYKATRNMF
eukprot:c17857_g1_i1 orf=565-738(+)